jgi:hypothetical protein
LSRTLLVVLPIFFSLLVARTNYLAGSFNLIIIGCAVSREIASWAVEWSREPAVVGQEWRALIGLLADGVVILRPLGGNFDGGGAVEVSAGARTTSSQRRQPAVMRRTC